MKNLTETETLQALIRDFFSDDHFKRRVKKGEAIIRQGRFNDTLYLVTRGQFEGLVDNPSGSPFSIFTAEKGMFVGVYSFFSGSFVGSSTVTAVAESEVAFIRYQDFESRMKSRECLYSRFMPVIMNEMLLRQKRLQQIYQEKEKAHRRLLHSQEMAALGQLASGISHELNNSITVVERNAQWISNKVLDLLNRPDPDIGHFTQMGIERGRTLSSREVRERKKRLLKELKLEEDIVRKLVQIDIPDDMLLKEAGTAGRAEQLLESWEIGVALHDALLAARQAGHVVKSVKALGAARSRREEKIDINETIRESLTLMRSLLHGIRVNTDLGDIPEISANSGELVQIWTNLIRNACESMSQAGTKSPQIDIITLRQGRRLQIRIRDNGPGIPPEILPRIFQPDMTTKINGLSFGLGLGLAIVERLVVGYHGTISVESSTEKTLFTIEFPSGDLNGTD